MKTVVPYNSYIVEVDHQTKNKAWQRHYTVRFTNPAGLKALMADTFADGSAVELRIRRGVRMATYCRIATVNGKAQRGGQKWIRLPDVLG